MKKLMILIFMLIIALTQINSKSISDASEIYYAKVQSDNVYFYNSLDESSSLFILPRTYFVILTSSASDTFYKAQYKDIIGYVKKSEVTVMSGTPENPFPDVQISTFLDYSLYQNPSAISLPLMTVKAYDTNIVYYGIKNGEYVSQKSSVWYYAKYTQTNLENTGYIYSIICDVKNDIPINNEYFDVIDYEIFKDIQTESSITSLSTLAKVFIVLGVSLPCALILYLLIKPTKIMEYSSTKAQAKKEYKSRKKSHGDYFEFDENDL